MSELPIPFNRPLCVEQALENMREAYRSRHVSGNGPFTRRCEDFLQQRLGAAKTLLTTSCTDALEMSALLLDLAPGDEIIMPSFTFVSTANAFVLRGAKPVFVDIRPDTLNLDERLLEAAITQRTRAIVVVHYAGVACEMDAICAIADRAGIAVIEDNAHGLLGSYRARPLGSFGRFSTASFHETKNLSCGEGGALVLNRSVDVARAEILREKGTDRSRYFRGEVDKYSWVDIGSSFLPSDLLAGVLWAQMEMVREIQSRRRTHVLDYLDSLRTWAAQHGVQLPIWPAYCDPSYHLFALVMPDPRDQASLIAYLKQKGINAVFHYVPLHLSPKGRSFGGQPGDCPVTESVSARLVRLPLYYDLSESERRRVIKAVLDYSPVTRS